MSEAYDVLKLEKQVCFPLYACAKEVVRRYRPYLDPLGLTYTQYIVMMVMWEQKKLTVGELGKLLYLDTGTLSPLLKTMEEKGLVTRSRDSADERVVTVAITPAGETLREQAADIPAEMGKCINVSPDEARVLYGILYKILG